MPFSVIAEAVRWSRKPWWDIPEGSDPKEATSALHTDEGMRITDHKPSMICDDDPDEVNLYTLAVDTRVLKKNDVFNAYCKEHPERIPPDDAGRPVLPILVEFFCTNMWEMLFTQTLATSGIRKSLVFDRKM